MELLPSPPNNVCNSPDLKLGEYANPTNGAKLFQSFLYNGMPVLPLTNCCVAKPCVWLPGAAVGLKRFPNPDMPYKSLYFGWIASPFGTVGTPIKSHRTPRFSVRLLFVRHWSCTNSARSFSCTVLDRVAPSIKPDVGLVTLNVCDAEPKRPAI